MRAVRLASASFLLLVSLCGGARAGEAWSAVGESGVPAPLSPLRPSLTVSNARIIIICPSSEEKWEWATVRAEYDLKLERRDPAPITVEVGLPVAFEGLFYRGLGGSDRSKLEAFVKLDGEAVEARFLSFADLARPTVRAWKQQIYTLLPDHPALWQRVKELSGKKMRYSWSPSEARAKRLARWMRENTEEREVSAFGLQSVAAGFLGGEGANRQAHEAVQDALEWLKPSHQRVDLYAELGEQWQHEPLLLDPRNGQLIDARSLEDEPAFGAFQFQITLTPNKEHRLVVQHRQRLGYGPYRTRRPFHGLRYVMKTARRWGGWYRTLIEVRVPRGWGKALLRPPASEVRREGGLTIYRLWMKSSLEDFYVSAVP